MCSPLSFSINGYDIIVYEDMYYVVRYIKNSLHSDRHYGLWNM